MYILKKHSKVITSLFFSLFFLFCVCSPVNAQIKSLTEGLSEKCMEEGKCKVEEIVIVVINIVIMVLSIIGSLALLFFIYGGLMYILSAGNPEKVTKATNSIKGAATGLMLVFSSYMIIKFVLTVLGVKSGSGLRIEF